MKHSSIQDWNTICNMRSTLLQLQFLYCSISEQVEEQTERFGFIHKDRLLQYEELQRKNNQLTQRNFKILLIAKLQQLIAVYCHTDNQIWSILTKFANCVTYIEQQKVKDVSKLYIGNKIMLDIGKCQEQLKAIQDKIIKYIEQYKGSIEEYNSKLLEVQELQDLWKQYLHQIKQEIKNNIQPGYCKYIRKRLLAKERELDNNIQILKKFISS